MSVVVKKRRYVRRNPKPGQLIAYYGKLKDEKPDVVVAWGGEGADKRHGNLLFYILGSERLELVHGDEAKALGRDWKFGKSAIRMLEEAGYDLSTLRFSIEMKKPSEE